MAEVPFASVRKWSALAFDTQDAEADSRGVFVLGALEMVEPYLAPDVDIVSLIRQTQSWSEQGLRVLLFAYNPAVTPLYDAAGEPTLPPLQPLGLISLRDELRPHAAAMLKQFTQMGIQLKVISGDNPHTVAALVKQTGIVEPKLVTGPEPAAMSAADFAQAAAETTIFGRIAPQQKEQLIETLIQGGHYAAMIGDGVNDILALKKAKLGIVMQSN